MYVCINVCVYKFMCMEMYVCVLYIENFLPLVDIEDMLCKNKVIIIFTLRYIVTPLASVSPTPYLIHRFTSGIAGFHAAGIYVDVVYTDT